MCEKCIHVYSCSLGFVVQILGITFIICVPFDFLSCNCSYCSIAMCSAPRCLENIILLTSDEYEAHCGRHFNVCCGGAGNIQEKLAANYAQDGPGWRQDGHLGSTREAWLDSQAARSRQVGTTWDALSHLIAKEAAKMAPR